MLSRRFWIISLFLKIAAVICITSVICIILDDGKREFSVVLRIFAVIITGSFLIGILGEKINEITDLTNKLDGYADIIPVLIKSAAICVLSEILCSVCKDSSNNALCTVVEFSAKVFIFILSFPFVESVIKTALSFIG